MNDYDDVMDLGNAVYVEQKHNAKDSDIKINHYDLRHNEASRCPAHYVPSAQDFGKTNP